MVDNSININKMNDISPQTFEHKKNPTAYGVRNPVVVWDMHKNV